MIVSYKTKSGVFLASAYITLSTLLVHSHFVKVSSALDEGEDVEIKNNDIECHFDVYASYEAYDTGLPPVESLDRVYPYDEARPAKEQAAGMLLAELSQHTAY